MLLIDCLFADFCLFAERAEAIFLIDGYALFLALTPLNGEIPDASFLFLD